MDGWDIIEVISDKLQIPKYVSENLQVMLEKEECTIPFIARYRNEKTRNMDAEKLREFQNCLVEHRDIQKKAVSYTKTIEKLGKLDNHTARALKRATTTDELNSIYEPFKSSTKRSHAERAKELGLEKAAKEMIENPRVRFYCRKFVCKGTVGLSTLSEVESGIKYIICDMIAKHEVTIKKCKEMFTRTSMNLVSKESASAKSASTKKAAPPPKGGVHKYQNYYNFQMRLSDIKSFQLLAINRGEAQKSLTVKIVIQERVEREFKSWGRRYFAEPIVYEEQRRLVAECVEDSYERLIKPKIIRRIRSSLTKSAQEVSVKLFSHNLKKLLLTPPVRKKIVLGVDPGYTHGCKCAVLSADGSAVLATDVFYLRNPREANDKVRRLYQQCRFEIIAIGSGTACRDTEKFFSQFLREIGNPNLFFCIVSEDGASHYSVTPHAKGDFPDLEPNIISAISIARRLLDPLSELIKYEARHLGIGQYQHDASNSKLNKAVSDVVEDCVTFVGVDLNAASPSLLSRIAGLKKNQVKNLLEWKKTKGPFINRQQIKQVGGIGEKTFEQCAGFLRISGDEVITISSDSEEAPAKTGAKRKNTKSGTASSRAKKAKISWQPNALDKTWIHPESYDVTNQFLNSLGLSSDGVGTQTFISQLKSKLRSPKEHAASLDIGEPTFKLIVDGLTQPNGFCDIRDAAESSKPIYRRDVLSMENLRYGMTLKGRVQNVTEFGVFLDIGVGTSGLLHSSKTKGKWELIKSLIGPNDVITVDVENIEIQKQRIGLRLVEANVGGMVL